MGTDLGQHFVPQHYLRHFAVKGKPKLIWVYDKEIECFKELPIKNVAQAPRFYFEEDESALSEQVEGPALKPIETLRSGRGVSQDERRIVAKYLQAMLYRVPRMRIRILRTLKRDFHSMVARLEHKYQPFMQDPNSPRELVSEFTKAFERLKQYDVENIPADFKKELLQRQWMSRRVVELLCLMTWRIIESASPNSFLTSDNPVYYFEWLGFGDPAVEVSVPLSSSVSLHASYRGAPLETLFIQANPSMVKEINRRTVSGAERFLFFHQDAEWVGKLAKKSRLSLNRILW